ncbi:MAG: diguanylate cyclase [Synergistales bacterium]|nr:diguanylate cyclase [Synergistales bacterium]
MSLSARIASLPPLISIVIAVVLLVLGDARSAEGLPAGMWAALMVLYILLTGLYVPLSALPDMQLSVASIQALCQGFTVLALALQFGLPAMVPWTGVALIAVGAATGGGAVQHALALKTKLQRNLQHAKQEEPAAQPPAETEAATGCPFPVIEVGGDNTVTEANDAFLGLLGIDRTAVQGQEVDMLLPQDTTRISLGGQDFRILHWEGQGRRLYCLLPAESLPEQGEPAEARQEQPRQGKTIVVEDPETGLFTEEYLQIQGPFELARAERYRRWLSAVLIAITYRKGEGGVPTDADRKDVLVTFSQALLAELRDTDLTFRLSNDTILFFLLETSQNGAKSFAKHLRGLFGQVIQKKQHLLALEPALEIGIHYYSGNEPLKMEGLMEYLQVSREKSRNA